jgi:hypothetical protein
MAVTVHLNSDRNRIKSSFALSSFLKCLPPKWEFWDIAVVYLQMLLLIIMFTHTKKKIDCHGCHSITSYVSHSSSSRSRYFIYKQLDRNTIYRTVQWNIILCYLISRIYSSKKKKKKINNNKCVTLHCTAICNTNDSMTIYTIKFVLIF